MLCINQDQRVKTPTSKKISTFMLLIFSMGILTVATTALGSLNSFVGKGGGISLLKFLFGL